MMTYSVSANRSPLRCKCTAFVDRPPRSIAIIWSRLRAWLFVNGRPIRGSGLAEGVPALPIGASTLHWRVSGPNAAPGGQSGNAAPRIRFKAERQRKTLRISASRRVRRRAVGTNSPQHHHRPNESRGGMRHGQFVPGVSIFACPFLHGWTGHLSNLWTVVMTWRWAEAVPALYQSNEHKSHTHESGCRLRKTARPLTRGGQKLNGRAKEKGWTGASGHCDGVPILWWEVVALRPLRPRGYLFSGGRPSPHGVPALAGRATEV